MTDFWMAAAEWWVRSAVVGGTVLLAGWLAVRVLAGPARRQQAAAWAVRVAVIVPILCLFPAWLTLPAPEWAVPVESEIGTAPAVDPGEPAGAFVAWPTVPEGYVLPEDAPGWQPAAIEGAVTAELDPTPVPASVVAPSAYWAIADVVPFALVLYAGMAGVLAGQLLAGYVTLTRLRWSAGPAPARVRELIDDDDRGWFRQPTVLVSDRVAAPLCFGLVRPTVLIPRRLADTASATELRWVLAHEFDHVHRGDHRIGWWVGAARALYWFVPWFWALRRELTLAQEYLADAAAAAADERPVDYAAFLVDLSDPPEGVRRSRAPLLAAGVMAGRSDLFRRVTMLLKFGTGVDRRVPRRWAAAVAGGLLAVAVGLSGVGWAAADDEKPKSEKKDTPKADADRSAPREGDRPRGPRDGDAPPKAGPRDGDRPAPRADMLELKKKIEAAMRKNDSAEVFRLIDELERSMMRPFPPAFRDGDRLAPRAGERPRDGERPAPREGDRPRDGQRDPRALVGPGDNRLRESADRTLQAFERAMDQLKDNPEARDQLRRAMEEYRRAMDLGRRPADGPFRGGFPGGEGLPGFGGFPGGEGLPGFGGFPGGEGLPGFGGFMIRGGSPRLGIATGPVPETLAEQLELPRGRGLIVADVMKDSAAAKAGLMKNDVILTFAGKDVSSNPAEFAERVAQTKSGEKLSITVLRKGKKEELKGVQLPEAEQPRRPAPLGGLLPGGMPPGGLLPGGLLPGRVAFERMEAVVKDGAFDVKASKGDLKYVVTGTIGENGRRAVTNVSVTDGEETSKYDSVAKVPEKHRMAVMQLLGSVGGGR